MNTSEPVRLLIWDLDETFWNGTLTEGGHILRQDTCDLVRTLASRGIISSICSKNDFLPVKKILEDANIWDYFIFPSISWEPKGPRIAALIESVQLRPSTVMFIDDNPLNLEEVRHYVPDIQVRSNLFIPSISGSELFVGKSDSALTRLAQYKLMEKRKRDVESSGSDASAFLRASNIRVDLDWDVEANLDRLIELINRTNQLNFTKQRLPEDIELARPAALEMLRRYNVQAALVRVKDRYGDHGYCGVFVNNSEHHALIHFCFSCRILGMGVEQWLYNQLGRPRLKIVGEVIGDPLDQSQKVDWINQVDADGKEPEHSNVRLDEIIAHGGCDLSAIAHYFGVHGAKVVSEFNIMRRGLSLRLDHTMFLGYAKSGITEDQLAVARRLGYLDSDFRSCLYDSTKRPSCILLSFATDAHHAIYRHRVTGIELPCLLGLGPVSEDQRKYDGPTTDMDPVRSGVFKCLKEEFDFVGIIGEAQFKQNISSVFESIDPSVSVFVLRPCEYHLNQKTSEKYYSKTFVSLNKWTSEVTSQFKNVTTLDLPDFVRDPSEVENILHYDRKVYFRVYSWLINELAARSQDAKETHEIANAG